VNIPFRRQLAGGLKSLLYARHGATPGAGVRVLEYHYIDDTGSPLSVSAVEFRKHLEILRDGGWRSLTSAEYLARLSRNTGVPPVPGDFWDGRDARAKAKEVFITFDDGHESFANRAVPLLLEFGFTATVFVVTDLVGKTAEWFERDRARIARLLGSFAFDRRERSAMEKAWPQFSAGKLSDVDELSELHQHGFGVECHSSRHRFLTELSAEELATDLSKSRDWLNRHLGLDSRMLCYPYGDWNDGVAIAAAAAGFEVGMLSEFTSENADQFRIGRIPIGGNGNVFALRFGLSRAAEVLAEMKEKKISDSRAKLMASPRDLAIKGSSEQDRRLDLQGTPE
jgi:peptidoglycan/xylan/chitin deacetylase (PgdA/CDA1 family)